MTRHDSTRASASALARVVGDTREFDQVWGRRHWLHQGPGYEDLLDLPGVDELLSTRGLRTPFLRVAKNGSTLPERSFTSPGGVGAAVADQISDSQLARHFADGATIVLQGLHRTWEPVIDFASSLATDLGHPVQANAYITPPQSQGFSAHYDVHDVFVLQLSGEKRWVIHEPVLQWPQRGETWESGGRREQVARAAEGEPALDVVLTPGDCLYLPRGYLHAATALGGVSAHLTLGLHVWTRRHLATEIVDRALSSADGLRRPLGLGVDVGRVTDIAEDAAAVRSALVAAIEAVPDDDLARLLDRRADDTARAAPISPLAQAAAVRGLAEDAPVVLRAHLRLRRIDEPGGIRLRGRGVDVLVDAPESLLDTLLDGSPHTLAEIRDHHAAAQEVVRVLLSAGVLVPVDRPA